MNIKDKITQKLKEECILSDEVQIREYVMNRKKQILEKHINEVCRIYRPGEGGSTKYFSTKLEPKNRKNQKKVYAKTLAELEDKIIAYYLAIRNESKLTVRDVLVNAVDVNSATGKRTLQRFDKHFSSISDLKISSLSEANVKDALSSLINDKVSKKEFNESIGTLNKICNYCEYEHIDIIDVKKIIESFRKVKLTGKHIFKSTRKKVKDLAFNKEEVTLIVQHAINEPSYKSLAIATLILTGLRTGELLALRIDDIDIDNYHLFIRQIEDAKNFNILDYCKENKSREVYLSAEAHLIIDLALKFRHKDNSDSPYLFLNENAKDGKLHLRAIDDYMRRIIHHDILKLDDNREARSPHDCRRTYASIEYLNGTDIYSLMKQLGHSSITQTEDYIKDIIDANERRNRLKGMGILNLISVDAM